MHTLKGATKVFKAMFCLPRQYMRLFNKEAVPGIFCEKLGSELLTEVFQLFKAYLTVLYETIWLCYSNLEAICMSFCEIVNFLHRLCVNRFASAL